MRSSPRKRQILPGSTPLQAKPTKVFDVAGRAERIAKAILGSGHSKSEVARACSVSASSVTQWITGETKSMKPEHLFALEAATGFCAKWIATGIGSEKTASEVANSQDQSGEQIAIKFLDGFDVAASEMVNGSDNADGILVNLRWIEAMGLNESQLCAHVIKTHEMCPTLSQGDVVLVNREAASLSDQGIFLFVKPGGALSIRRARQLLTGDWCLQADNHDRLKHPDEIVNQDNLLQLNIAGKIFWRSGNV
jgi:phage repressor protein C with HTH and peptisase S24 domain